MRRLAAVVGLCCPIVLINASAQAQFSPRCRLNGHEVFCAMAAYGTGSDGWQKTTVVLADSRTIQLHHNDHNCRPAQPANESICPARLTMIDSKGSHTFFGTYRLRSYEGGVTHEYQAGPVDLQFFYMD
ncbi:TPA: hypothetical protein Q4A38_07485 [Synechococcus sp. WH 5701]